MPLASNPVFTLVACAAWLTFCSLVQGAEPTSPESLYYSGKYAEAIAALDKIEQPDADASLLKAKSQIAIGKSTEATKTLNSAIEKKPTAKLYAELARLQFDHGQWDEATANCKKALVLDERQPVARWITAQLHRERGELEEAGAAYEWFVDDFNANDVGDDPDQLYYAGLGAAEFARWTKNSEQFSYLVNTLFPTILERSPNYWPARIAVADLFAEKFNMGSARSEWTKALEINPSSAELFTLKSQMDLTGYNVDLAVASADQALAIRGDYVPALEAKAKAYLADFRPLEAIEALKKAREINDKRQATAGLLAAAYLAADGAKLETDEGESTRYGELIETASLSNPHCGEFFAGLGEGCELLRKYPYAASFYRAATERMPQLVRPHAELGMVLMRMGEEPEARVVLEEAFAADPFHVRVKNTLEVLDVLATYETLETDHFVIRYDPKDKLLAEYAARHLEDNVYAPICKALGYEPADKTLIEFFSKAKNTSGHGWFSARMVGLPYIGTVGACAGKMLALASPSSMPQKYNWGNVLRHEFVHVVNLQQTDFNIPHWFTEAMAVTYETEVQPPDWKRLLAKRIAANDLFDLNSINYGFIRPRDGDDWTMAYCQAYHYAVYLKQRFGEDALLKMLDGYAKSLTTDQILEQTFHTKQADFERGYRDYLVTVVRDVEVDTTADKSFSQLIKEARDEPKNADIQADAAYAYLQRQSNTSARKYAEQALEIDPEHPLGLYVMARLYLSIGDAQKTIELLERATGDRYDRRPVALLAGLRLKQKDYKSAIKLYDRGAKAEPESEEWTEALVRVHLLQGNDDELIKLLPILAAQKHHDVAIRKKLATLLAAKEDWKGAARWSEEAFQIDVADAQAHEINGRAQQELGDKLAASRELAVAFRLSPDRVDWGIAAAEALIAVSDEAAAQEILEAVLKHSPSNAAAKQLLEKIKP
ncbi:tetratricopeptide repeat protein [Blastopirellula sp. JC732]|uniref:Tetratricopeptide repeat protein n=1 Tax=Blastopirellula sediminis TaxID=2894196 RepID=A0A9X1MRB0_9BACT|nr:tetratricopeptide repeat protein [Blastopirellula sediminis]MCC9605461.1 tetratricopeptide repeat protein [Blastopirellula sediminis]MCC9631239.1 tetratricopeptide repeat protein [Blastopirellula sediminis]